MNESDRARDKSAGRVPAPAHPRRRHEPLPWTRPKPGHEDPDAPARIKAILESPSYRQADRDVDFLNKDDTRGLRLQLDYLKPEFALEDQGIGHTIVVFGSTRIPEPDAARKRFDELEALLADDPGDAKIRQRLAIAERILAKSNYYEVARDFGALVGKAEGPHGKRLVVVTGGGPGIMEAANRGAYDTGARTVGLNITLPHEQFPNPYVTPDLCFRFHYFALRKLHFLMRARALVAFPGGYGTFDELFEALTLIQSRKIAPMPVILVGEEFWRGAFDPEFLVAEGTIDPEDRELFWFAETAEEIWRDIRHWYELAGLPFIP
jgi:uncharacterized protein (TIGR00730 family)